MSSPRLSPDGRYLASVQSYNGRPAVTVYDLSLPGTPPTVIPSNEWLVEDVAWAKADRLVIFLSRGDKAYNDNMLRTWGRAIVVSPLGEDLVILFNDHKWVNFNLRLTIQDVALDEPDHIYMPLYVLNETQGELRSELYRVNVRNGETERVARGTRNTIRWITDGHGKIVARIDETQRPLTHHVMLAEGDDWREVGIYPATDGQSSGILGLTESGTSFAQGLVVGDKEVIAQLPLTGGTKRTMLYANPEFDISAPIYDEWTRRVVGAVFVADRPETVFFDAKRQSLKTAMTKAFPGISANPISWSVDLQKVVVEVEGPETPPTFYLVDRGTGTADLILSTYAGVDDERLAEMRPWPYAARDGLEIPAYLTIPRGAAPRNLPLIVMPHGGPDLRDYIAFDWWAQYLASRGYAVLQPNYRGSTGFGLAFNLAGRRQWGLKMQDDISDGVAKAIADGIADPKRICIVGDSYGG